MLDRVSPAPTPRMATPAAAPRAAGAYRADIDGLRGIAVASVVAFHAFPSALRGGFVGVDVFFVISGYLITRIIEQGLAAGSCSFATFYARRVLRLFPALLLVFAAVYLLGWGYLLDSEFASLGSHLAAGAAFSANLIQMHEAGYFDAAALAKPLLHLWSLGIEEQFYLCWPLLLFAAWRLRWRPVLVLLGALACSFALNMAYVVEGRAVTDFYSPLSRSWELAAGGVLACVNLAWLRSRVREAAAWAGAALLVSSFALMGAGAYPGMWACLPVAGTALVIAAGERAWLNRTVLAWRPLVGLGLISYPLYLWHWPLLSFASITETGPLTVTERCGAMLLALGFAAATYRFVERPLRFGAFALRQRVAALCAGMLAVALAGGLTYARSGFSSRVANSQEIINQGETGHDAYFDYMAQHDFPCTPHSIWLEAEKYKDHVRCFQSKSSERRDIALIGDSHSEDLLIGLGDSLPDKNVVSYMKGFGMPLPSYKDMGHIFDQVARDANIKTVVISSAWVVRAESWLIDELKRELMGTAQTFLDAHKAVFIVDDKPNFHNHPKFCKYSAMRHPFWVTGRVQCTIGAAAFAAEQGRYSRMLTSITAQLPQVRIIRAGRAFCDDAACHMDANGKLLFRDADHLTVAGTERLGRWLVVNYPGLGE